MNDKSAPATADMMRPGSQVTSDPISITHEELAEWLKLVASHVPEQPRTAPSSSDVLVLWLLGISVSAVTLAWVGLLIGSASKALGLP